MAVLGVLGVLLEMGWNGRVRICMIEWWGTRKLILASEVGDLAKEKVTERFGSNWTISVLERPILLRYSDPSWAGCVQKYDLQHCGKKRGW